MVAFTAMTRPSFLLIGAAKAGTTAVYDALRQHPQVFLARNKEPSYFAWQERGLDVRGPGDRAALAPYVVTDWEAYQRLFAGAGGALAAGEASTAYLYHSDAAANIHGRLPGARLIAILRQPADRAYAAWLHLVRDGRESLAFADALEAEQARIAAGWEQLWHYRAMGRYAGQLERYYARFKRQQMHVLLHDELRADPRAILAELFAFLDVDPAFAPILPARSNPGGIPRFPWLYRLLATPRRSRVAMRRLVPAGLRAPVSALLRRWQVARPPLEPGARADLTEGFRDEILRLQDLLDRDLGAWLA